ncbi:MAG: hypothetical protein OXR84_02905 [Magnetovibrio sp.]|nr:hypothetical protein [Magnetovibrio sp.]
MAPEQVQYSPPLRGSTKAPFGFGASTLPRYSALESFSPMMFLVAQARLSVTA